MSVFSEYYKGMGEGRRPKNMKVVFLHSRYKWIFDSIIMLIREVKATINAKNIENFCNLHWRKQKGGSEKRSMRSSGVKTLNFSACQFFLPVVFFMSRYFFSGMGETSEPNE